MIRVLWITFLNPGYRPIEYLPVAFRYNISCIMKITTLSKTKQKKENTPSNKQTNKQTDKQTIKKNRGNLTYTRKANLSAMLIYTKYNEIALIQ